MLGKRIFSSRHHSCVCVCVCVCESRDVYNHDPECMSLLMGGHPTTTEWVESE